MVKRDIATPLTIGAFLLMAVTGILMFFHWDSGFNKVAHEWLGWLLVIAVGLHVMANISAFKNHFKKPTGKLIVGLLVALLALTFLPQSVLGNKGGGRPPIEQAMKVLTSADIATIAQLTRTTPDALKTKLANNGYPSVTDSQTISQIAGGDREKQGQILNVVLSDDSGDKNK